jgi:hypothetical protein
MAVPFVYSVFGAAVANSCGAEYLFGKPDQAQDTAQLFFHGQLDGATAHSAFVLSTFSSNMSRKSRGLCAAGNTVAPLAHSSWGTILKLDASRSYAHCVAFYGPSSFPVVVKVTVDAFGAKT